MTGNVISCVLAVALVLPTLSLASTTDQGVTRAQVRAELSQLEQAGFQPGAANINYPYELRHAERTLRESRASADSANTATVASASKQGL
ncbi:hypothetical protein ABH945_005788 [Paraburkholderia sp. GAS333]|uniref:DUF4148 domain-containing protein n=1 Tax=Paraburkholderia sp. GAS333 TaxID=3156279 RepID=UPI003D1D15BD